MIRLLFIYILIINLNINSLLSVPLEIEVTEGKIEPLPIAITNFSYKSAIIIGLLQVLSLIPGVSRSGISITGARFLQFKRIEAAKISFLLSIPTLGAVTIFGLRNLYLSDNLELSALNLISIICSFIFSFVTIHFFLRYIQKFSLNLFVIYRLILGIVLLFLAYL